MAEQLYRIHWKAKRTGATGCGSRAFPKEEAEGYADQMNSDVETSKWTEHWIEPAPKSE